MKQGKESLVTGRTRLWWNRVQLQNGFMTYALFEGKNFLSVIFFSKRDQHNVMEHRKVPRTQANPSFIICITMFVMSS